MPLGYGFSPVGIFLLSVYGWRQSRTEEMSVTNNQPKDSFESPRFCGIPTFMRLPCKQTLTDVDFIVAGIPFDTGSSLGPTPDLALGYPSKKLHGLF